MMKSITRIIGVIISKFPIAATITVAIYTNQTPGNERSVIITPATARIPANIYRRIIPILMIFS